MIEGLPPGPWRVFLCPRFYTEPDQFLPAVRVLDLVMPEQGELELDADPVPGGHLTIRAVDAAGQVQSVISTTVRDAEGAVLPMLGFSGRLRSSGAIPPRQRSFRTIPWCSLPVGTVHVEAELVDGTVLSSVVQVRAGKTTDVVFRR